MKKWFFLAALSLALPQWQATSYALHLPTLQEKKADDPLAKQFEELRKSIATEQAASQKRYNAATDAEDKKKILADFRKFRTDTTEKLNNLALANPKHADAFPYLAEKAIAGDVKVEDLLLEHHLQNPALGELCLTIASIPAKRASEFIQKVEAKAKAKEIQGMVLLSKAVLNQSKAAFSRDEQKNEKLQAEALKFYEAALKDYPDVETSRGTIKQVAEPAVFELKFLAVGRPAPAMEGEDLENKPIKLSDYKGKVVLIDFWAHW